MTSFNPGNRGITLILVAGLLFLFFIFFIVAIDFAYVYYVRGQLQNSADASCLAGAAMVDVNQDPLALDEVTAKQEAKQVASANFAAASPVQLNDEDIEFGSWDGINRIFTAGTAPATAIHVKAQRTVADPDGRFGLLFARIADWSEMTIGAKATCTVPRYKLEVPVVLCAGIFDGIPLEENGVITGGPSNFYWAPYTKEVDPGVFGIAWTLFDPDIPAPTGASDLRKYFCGDHPRSGCLSDPVYSDNGYKTSVARQFRCAFYNPNHDSSNKTIVGGMVTEWRVVVPVFETSGCPPGGDQKNPHKIIGWGWITITEVYASIGDAPPDCACEVLFNENPAIYNIIKVSGTFPNAIQIKAIEYPEIGGVTACLISDSNSSMGILVE
jgi:hypothetical protein